MMLANRLSDLLTMLFHRKFFAEKIDEKQDIKQNCLALLSEKDEATGHLLSAIILKQYQGLDANEKYLFFRFLNEELDINATNIKKAVEMYQLDSSPSNFESLFLECESKRQILFRQLNEAPSATASIVKLRADLLTYLKKDSIFARTDFDLVQLFRSWFNRGFLVIQQINWNSPAIILEKIIAYEAVHEIQSWDDLRRRLLPTDRCCFAFFHPSMPDEPLIFVEVALMKSIPNSIQSVLSEEREIISEQEASTAVFYSISNCQKGLAGISFGNSLIKQVVRDLSHELPNIKNFVTLSPIPKLANWVDKEASLEKQDNPKYITQIAAKYLLEEKTKDGLPVDSVARFHLGNGAVLYAIHAHADTSEAGMAKSFGVMVNYLYDVPHIAENATDFSKHYEIKATSAVKNLANTNL